MTVSAFEPALPDTATYIQYFSGYGVKENTNNPGNDDPTDVPPVTTTYAATNNCNAVQTCAAFLAGGDYYIYQSFDVHHLANENEWECVIYYDQNTDPSYFNVQDADVGAAYGYSYQFQGF